jgi:pyruvate dehydrogenase E2 component (dihydrolipoamide acetyltransferase)
MALYRTCRSRKCARRHAQDHRDRLVQAATIPHFISRPMSRSGDCAARGRQCRRAQRRCARDYRLVNDLIIKMWRWRYSAPAANAVWADDRMLRFKHSDIGIAVAIDGGLITPVIRQAELKSLTAISAEMRELAERARSRKLKPDEYQGGASAISNLGMYGVREFSAIINPPHATILAVGASRRQAIEKDDGSVGFASMMT